MHSAAVKSAILKISVAGPILSRKPWTSTYAEKEQIRTFREGLHMQPKETVHFDCWIDVGIRGDP